MSNISHGMMAQFFNSFEILHMSPIALVVNSFKDTSLSNIGIIYLVKNKDWILNINLNIRYFVAILNPI